jgi:hypothetical protein
MCAFCTMLAGAPHWTEAGTDSGRSGATPVGNARFVDRAYRLKLINRILRFYGCKADDWAGGQYLVHSHRGRTEVVERLPQIWMTVEAIATKPVDPLDPQLLSVLDDSAPAAREEMR